MDKYQAMTSCWALARLVRQRDERVAESGVVCGDGPSKKLAARE